MAITTATRRLAEILAADVVGYSRLMGADEEGTHERFKAHLRELVEPKIREHHGRIVKTTGDGALVAAEAARPTNNPDALDYILRGRAVEFKPPSRDGYAERISLFEHALALDPQSAEAQSQLAGVLMNRAQNGMTDSAAADLSRAEGLVDQALAASPRSAYAHYVKGRVLQARNRYDDAIPEYETALALNRNFAGALTGLGWSKLFSGSIEEVIPLEEQAIRLSPRDPLIGYRYLLIGTVHLLQSRTDEAVVWLEKGRSAMPAVPSFHGLLAAAYALRGKTERAASELAEARRLAGEGFFFEHRAHASQILGSAEDPRLVRRHLSRRLAQGRDAGGMTDTRRAADPLAIAG